MARIPASAVPLLFAALACAAATAQLVQTPLTAKAMPVASTNFSVVARGAHFRVWQRTDWRTNAIGRVTAREHGYTELATGMHHLVNGRWVESSDQIQITPTGGEATNSQHSVVFLGSITARGAVDITLPEGVHLTSNILGLSYFDTVSGSSVMIAEAKDADGSLLPSGNQVLYRDAFTGLSADVLYINSIHGVEQLIVLHEQPPPPSTWGLDPHTTVLEVITEFLNPPEPAIAFRPLGNTMDEHLSFGVMQMGRGEAFALGSETNTVPVAKQWLVMDGRTCLVEQVLLAALQPELEQLPPGPSGSASRPAPPDGVMFRVARRQLLPSRKLAAKRCPALQLAVTTPSAKGLALDYNLLISQTNLTLQSDSTYYIDSLVNISGTLTIEGGSVVKFTNCPSASLAASNLVCQSAPFRMAVFTSKDDDSIGDVIPGSTGDPSTNFYGSVGLDLSLASSPKVSGMRFSYLSNALAGSGITFRDCQFLHCISCLGSAGASPALYNVLIQQAGGFINPQGSRACPANGDNFIAVNVTAHYCTNFLCDTTGNACYTNCLFVCVTNWHCLSTSTNSSAFLNSDAGVFQTVAAGSHYLADDSPYRNAGTTNAVDPSLLADLRSTTTYPPINYSNVTLTADTTLAPQAQRDTSGIDLGFHYAPLDYYLSQTTLSNATLTVLPGTCLGVYPVGGYSVALWIGAGGNLQCNGNASSPVYIAQLKTVQEQPFPIHSRGDDVSVLQFTHDTPLPQMSCTFTKFCAAARDGHHFNGYPIATQPAAFQSCQFLGGQFFTSLPSVDVTNCLFDRTYVDVEEDSDGFNVGFGNNLFRGGTFLLGQANNSVWVFRDNLFDGTDVQNYSGPISPYNLCHNNAYAVTTDVLFSTNGPGDINLTNAFIYLPGPLGNYYQPTNSPLLNAGSTNANLVGLYHYTVLTNEIKEATNTVSIGYHYVAVNSYGNPIDTDADGTPDYLEDANGNGLVDSGETDWKSAGEFGLKVLITRPQAGSILP